MPAVVNVMKENAALVTLVKPQFEARRSQVRNTYSYLYNFTVCLVIVCNNTVHLTILYLASLILS